MRQVDWVWNGAVLCQGGEPDGNEESQWFNEDGNAAGEFIGGKE